MSDPQPCPLCAPSTREPSTLEKMVERFRTPAPSDTFAILRADFLKITRERLEDSGATIESELPHGFLVTVVTTDTPQLSSNVLTAIFIPHPAWFWMKD